MRVLIAGGGTGGHVIPALAIAREMRDRYGAEVRFIGSARGLETRLVPEAGFPLDLIQVGQLNRVALRTRIRTLADLPLGILRCGQLIRAFKPEVAIGVGGYVSGPAMLAAILLRVPTLAYEPNAVPGLVNRRIGRWVSAAAVNFEQAAPFFRNATVTGVPVREAIFAIQPKTGEPSRRLLVTAGSQGAKIFNETMPSITAALLDAVPALEIVHQAGPKQHAETLERYRVSGANAGRWQVVPFLDDMPAQYEAADLVLARAGSTVAELAAAGRPSVLVPLPQAADNHQHKNAEVLAQTGAAYLLPQAELTSESLCAILTELLLDPQKLLIMGQRAKALARPGAVESIGRLIQALENANPYANRPHLR